MSGMTTGTWWMAGSPARDWPWLPGLFAGWRASPRFRVRSRPRLGGWKLLRFAQLSAGDDAYPVSREDAQDIRECLEGDEEAFAKLVRRYQQPIANYMWRFTQNATTQDPIVQWLTSYAVAFS